jgi:hypothetical protein
MNLVHFRIASLLLSAIGMIASCKRVEMGIDKTMTFPGRDWVYIQQPEQTGWNSGKLDSLKKYLVDSTTMTGFMITQKGKVVFEYGDIQEVSYIASCRKSVLAMIYGEHIKTGEINLHATLLELGIDDVGGLSVSEKQATLEDLISARSRVFHPPS